MALKKRKSPAKKAMPATRPGVKRRSKVGAAPKALRPAAQVIAYVGGRQPRFTVKPGQGPEPMATLPAAVRAVSDPVGISTKLRLVQTANRGMTASEFRTVQKALPVEEKAWAELLSLPISRSQGTSPRPSQRLSVLQSEQVYLVAAVFLQAIKVLEGRTTALEWLTTPSALFGDKAPIQLLRTSTGADLVLDQLGRMEHGVYS